MDKQAWFTNAIDKIENMSREDFLQAVENSKRPQHTVIDPISTLIFCDEAEGILEKMEEVLKRQRELDLHVDITKVQTELYEATKHPYIFNIEDLLEDETEFERMKNSLEERKKDEELLGWPSPPLMVATSKAVEVNPLKIDDFVKSIKELAKEYDVELYFGPRSFLKSILYPFLYSGKLDCKVVEDDPFDKLESLSRGRNIGIVGALGLAASAGKIGWGIEEISISTPASQDRQDWKQSKLHCGKGHNKHKRKGKK